MAAGAAALKREPETAEAAYKKALSLNAQSISAQLALGNFYTQSNRLAEAEQQYKATAASDPASKDAQVALATLYVQTQRMDLAEAIYIQLSNSSTDQKLVLAEYYSSIDQAPKGIAVLQKVIDAEPDHALATRRLASLLLAQADYEKASALIDGALTRDENDFDARIIKGRILLAQNRTYQAIQELQKVTKARPALQMGRFLLGMAYYQAQDLS